MRLSSINENEYADLADSDKFGAPTVRLPCDDVEFPVTRVDADRAPIRTQNGGQIWTSPTGWKVFVAWTGCQAALVNANGKVVARGHWQGSGNFGAWQGTKAEFSPNKLALLRRSGFTLTESEYDGLGDEDEFDDDTEQLIDGYQYDDGRNIVEAVLWGIEDHYYLRFDIWERGEDGHLLKIVEFDQKDEFWAYVHQTYAVMVDEHLIRSGSGDDLSMLTAIERYLVRNHH